MVLRAFLRMVPLTRMVLRRRRLGIRQLKPVLKLYVVFAIIGGAAVVLSLLPGFGACIIHTVIGIPCPACGLTRAFINLAGGSVITAFAYHPLFLLVPLIPFIVHTGINEKWQNILAVSVLVIFTGVYVLRMVLLFPQTPPMDLNHDALAGRIIRHLTLMFE